MNTKRMFAVVIGMLLATGVAWGKLPPPSPAEASAQKAAAEKKAKADEFDKQALARAQDRVAARYKTRRHK